MFCRHQYKYTQGYFVCVKCRKSVHQHRTRYKKSKKPIGIILGVIIAVIGFFLFYPSFNPIHITIQNFTEVKIPKPIQVPSFTLPHLSVSNFTQIKIPDPRQTITNVISPQPTQTQSSPAESPNTDNGKPVINIPELEQKIHLLINSERQQNNIPTLMFDSALTSIALSHSQDMANRNYFSHYTPEGADPTARGLSAGYHCHKDLSNGYYTEGLAENIYQNNLYDSYQTLNGVIVSHDWNDMNTMASSTVQGWMESPGHRENILDPVYDREGIGVAIASDDKVYITEDFC